MLRMLSLSSRIPLSSGHSIPILGLGVYLADDTTGASLSAIRTGYRLLDTATDYRNEAEVGKAVKECGLSRDQIFVTTKLWVTDHGREKTLKAFHNSLKRLDLDYVDLYLIHSPSGGHILETWDTLIELQKQGLIKSIGVSNFNVLHLQKLMEARPHAKPAVNQIEVTPFLTRDEVVSYCQSHNIIIEAYSPLTKGSLLNDPGLVTIAKKYNKSPAQCLIRWSLQRGFVCIPKSSNEKRIKENADIFDFEISPEDMATMNSWNRNAWFDWDVIDTAGWLP